MKISFYGAAGEVTGSKHLIQTDNFNLLLDCGLHQGRRREANALNRQLPFDPKTIDAVILSHAHADHCGMIPILVKQGFRGKIYATPATVEIAKYILLDSAKIQEQDAIYFNDNLPVGADPIAPLYTEEDVKASLSYFEPVPYFRLKPHWTKISDAIRFKFYDAGHILGSAMPLIEITEKTGLKRIGFTGDMGKPGAPLLWDPEIIREPLDAFLMECTYGNYNHRPLSLAVHQLEHIIMEAFHSKSKIIVPAFALGRTQELIYTLHQLTDQKRIPRIPIYIDSPLAINIGQVFMNHTEDFGPEAWHDFGKANEVPFMFRNLTYIHSVEESKQLNSLPGPFMVISASGMCEGGRVLHHLKNNIEDRNAIILLTGYQAQNTLGRKLHHGISPVNIFGRPYRVRAKIMTLNEFSAHADQQALLQYIKHIPAPKKLFLVHGEPEQAEALEQSAQTILKKYSTKIITPSVGESFDA